MGPYNADSRKPSPIDAASINVTPPTDVTLALRAGEVDHKLPIRSLDSSAANDDGAFTGPLDTIAKLDEALLLSL
jgi:hypothetical protein